MWTKWYVWLLPVLVLLPIVAFYVMSFTAARPSNLGVRAGKLAPCPASPNCVSTQADDEAHCIAPIPFTGTTGDALAKLKQALATLPCARSLRKERIICTSNARA